MSPRLEGVAAAAAIVLGVGVGYEVLVATEVVRSSSVPGEGASGAAIVLAASLLALLVGASASFARSTIAHRPKAVVWVSLPVLGAAYMVAHWASFDPYYAPTLRRYSDGGVADSWIVAMVLAAAVAATAAAILPRLGAALAALVLLVEAFTVFVMPLGK